MRRRVSLAFEFAERQMLESESRPPLHSVIRTG